MLVLSRKPNESIVIGPDISVRVIRVQGNRVRIGVDAPPEVAILRDEVFDSIKSSSDGQLDLQAPKQNCA